MGDVVNFRLVGPDWWLNMVGEFRLRLQKEVAEGGLTLPLTVTDDVTDGARFYVAVDVRGNFSAMAPPTLMPTAFPLTVTIRDAGGPHPLTINRPGGSA